MAESMFTKAVEIALKAHSSQMRKGCDIPYIIHPIRVSELILKNWPDIDNREELRVAAVLHDVLEDTDYTEEEMKKTFGEFVTKIVLEVSEDKKLPKDERKRKYVHQLKNASDYAKILKLCDIWDNINDPFENWEGFLHNCKGTLSAIEMKNEVFLQNFNEMKEKTINKIDNQLEMIHK